MSNDIINIQANRAQLAQWREQAERERPEEMQAIRDGIAELAKRKLEARAALPLIQITHEEEPAIDGAIDALVYLDSVFVRGGSLVEIIRPDPRLPSKIREIPLVRLRELLSISANYYVVREKEGKKEGVFVRPPTWIAAGVEARGQWPGIQPLRAVVNAPCLRSTGAVVQSEGYNGAAGIYLDDDPDSLEFPHIAHNPPDTEIAEAVALLREAVCDFPFADDSHLAAWVALVLTPFARLAIDGCVPLVAIDATTRGTGKSKLADLTSIIVTGHDAPKMAQPSDDTEMRKRITALQVEGARLVCLDNISRPIDDPSLDACLTSTIWKDRVLGETRTFEGPNNIVWIATGNNLQFGGDTVRRVLHCRLESPLENPETREGFQHPDLLAWARDHRHGLVWACLTILRGYYAAGRPDMGVKPWGSFEAWTRLVAHCVKWAGFADPTATRSRLESSADAEKNALGALLESWAALDASGQGVSCSVAIERAYGRWTSIPGEYGERKEFVPGDDALREAIEALCPMPPGKQVTAHTLGNRLRRFRRRIIGGKMLDCLPGRHVKWTVRASS